jgi:DNA-directed RNA polymerase subunit beta'
MELLQFDGLRTVSTENNEGKKIQVVIGRTGEIRNLDVKSDRMLNTMHIPYGAVLNVKDGQKVSKGDSICTWDPYNNVIVAEVNLGTISNSTQYLRRYHLPR